MYNSREEVHIKGKIITSLIDLRIEFPYLQLYSR